MGARKNALAPNAGWTAHSINSQFEGLQLVEYNMQGSQKATTTVIHSDLRNGA